MTYALLVDEWTPWGNSEDGVDSEKCVEDDEVVICVEVICKDCEIVDDGNVDDIGIAGLDSVGRLMRVVGAMRKDTCAAC